MEMVRLVNKTRKVSLLLLEVSFLASAGGAADSSWRRHVQHGVARQ